jgi:hypothetical protein
MLSFLAQQAEDAEGFIEHNGDVLDIFMLVAVIVFLGAAAVAWSVQPRHLWATVLSIGLAAMAFALLFL